MAWLGSILVLARKLFHRSGSVHNYYDVPVVIILCAGLGAIIISWKARYLNLELGNTHKESRY
jgi:hypothetical protein